MDAVGEVEKKKYHNGQIELMCNSIQEAKSIICEIILLSPGKEGACEKEEEEEEQDSDDFATLPYAVRCRHSVAWTHRKFMGANDVLRAVLHNECALRRAEGLRVAYIDDTLYVDGQVRPLSKNDHKSNHFVVNNVLFAYPICADIS